MDPVTDFEEHRPYLRQVAYRVLGSLSEADDAVQEAWIRLHRADPAHVDNPRAWLTTVVARVALNQLRARRTRREQAFPDHLPDPVVRRDDAGDPEYGAELADSVGLALLVVLETLAPDERLAFVLHDMFGLPFDEIAPLVERTPAAARQLASRARRRVRGAEPASRSDRGARRQVVDAFLAAAREGDIEGLVAVLDPDVVLRADTGTGLRAVHGARAVAGQAAAYRSEDQVRHPVLVNGAPGVLGTVDGRPVALLAFTVDGGRITEIDILADPARLAGLDPELLR
ncbi:sigma-70 family RNA polymerase sigma factor [Pseudonocardia kujensis]|uniref:sigma-70 family RNA polymerase sigma factor n=1 Tax=Pseudonocardia kujensis TaxID=1128675 RepID=UPI001E56B93B|nr:sigma-70 family RNA polymerase sigma factor [Pseudonocardia kujensis]MCE0761716.1 sigma-70 family RNA polymerase sigma factor [Pseudonocardia kujensis]